MRRGEDPQDMTLNEGLAAAAALAEPSAGGGDAGSGHTAVSAPPDDDPVGRILEDIKRLTIADLRRLHREINRLLRP